MMFIDAKAFNQPIGDWDVSKVTSMELMFSDAKAFNQPIGDWDVSNVTNMNSMFENTEAFNHPIGDWDLRAVTQMKNMFNGSQLIEKYGINGQLFKSLKKVVEEEEDLKENINENRGIEEKHLDDIGDGDIREVLKFLETNIEKTII